MHLGIISTYTSISFLKYNYSCITYETPLVHVSYLQRIIDLILQQSTKNEYVQYLNRNSSSVAILRYISRTPIYSQSIHMLQFASVSI